MPSIGIAWRDIQTGDEVVFCIPAHVSFIPHKVLHLMDVFAVLIFELMAAFDPPARIGVTGALPVIFVLFVFGCVHIRNAMHTFDHLDAAKLDARSPCSVSRSRKRVKVEWSGAF